MLRRILLRLLLLAFIAGLGLALMGSFIQRAVRAEGTALITGGQVAPHHTAIVLGCRVSGEVVSGCLEERLLVAQRLYAEGRVQRLLLSGDHGREGYDEVNAMKDWLMARGVPEEHIFLDHAGFDTYDSMVRAKKVYQVPDAIVISQSFHLPRALFLAQRVGLDAVGVSADPPQGSVCRGSSYREPLACVKAWLDVQLGSDPRFLGPVIPITGSPQATFDKPSGQRNKAS